MSFVKYKMRGFSTLYFYNMEFELYIALLTTVNTNHFYIYLNNGGRFSVSDYNKEKKTIFTQKMYTSVRR